MAGGGGAVASGTRPPATVEGATSDGAGTSDVELTFMVPGMAEPVVGALSDGEATGGGATGDGVGVVEVWVGSAGEVTAVELRFMVPGTTGTVVGALPDGEATGGGATGDGVGVVEVWVGSAGDEMGFGRPLVGAEVGCCGEAGVGVGVGG